MRKPKPEGRTRIITGGGKILADEKPQKPVAPPPDPSPKQESPRAWRAGIPLSHGRLTQEQVEALDARGKARRSGEKA